jgi:hypothetical protein
MFLHGPQLPLIGLISALVATEKKIEVRAKKQDLDANACT